MNIRKRFFTAAQALLSLVVVHVGSATVNSARAQPYNIIISDSTVADQNRHIASAVRWLGFARERVASGQEAGFALNFLGEEVKNAGGYNNPAIAKAGLTEKEFTALQRQSQIFDVIDRYRNLLSSTRSVPVPNILTPFEVGIREGLLKDIKELLKIVGYSEPHIRAAGITPQTISRLEQKNHTATIIMHFQFAQRKVTEGEDATESLRIIDEELKIKDITLSAQEIVAAHITRQAIDALKDKNHVYSSVDQFKKFEDNVAKGGNIDLVGLALLRKDIENIGFDNPQIIKAGITPIVLAILETQNDINAIIYTFSSAQKLVALGQDVHSYVMGIDDLLRKVGGISNPRLKEKGITPESLYELDKKGGINLAREYYKKARKLWRDGHDNAVELRIALWGIIRAGGLRQTSIKLSDWLQIGGQMLKRDGTRARLPDRVFVI